MGYVIGHSLAARVFPEAMNDTFPQPIEGRIQSLLQQLGRLSPEEWVCHIHARANAEGETYLESAFSSLIEYRSGKIKISAGRDRYDSSEPADPTKPPREVYWISVQELHQSQPPRRILTGMEAVRIFVFLKERSRGLLVDEAVSLELNFDAPLTFSEVRLQNHDFLPSFDDLLYLIDNVPPAEWKIHYVQHGGIVDFCQRRMTAHVDCWKIALSENLLSAVDMATTEGKRPARYEFEVRTDEGQLVQHALTEPEIQKLYFASRDRLLAAKSKFNP